MRGVCPFEHEDFRRGFEVALGTSTRGGADVGEVLVTAARIEDGDRASWGDA